jgi:hypothetical protein
LATGVLLVAWVAFKVNADLDTLSKECKKLNRWTFFIVIAAWKIRCNQLTYESNCYFLN